MPPPQLAADAPVADIVRPVEIALLHALRHQTDVPVLHRFHGGLNQLLHLHEPLLFHQRLYGRAAAVMGAHVVGIVLNLDQKPQGIQFLYDGFPGFVAIHSGVFPAVLVDGGVVIHDVDDGKVMALSHLKVVGVMGGGNLHHARAELPVHVGVGDHGNHPVHQGQHHALSNQMAVSFILGMDGYGGIAQHGLRTGGGKGQEPGGAGRSVLLHHRVLDMPQMSGLFLVYHLCVGDGGIADRAPVDDAGPLVDIALFVHLYEDFGHGLVAAIVHSEALSVPVTGGAQFLQLFHDASAVFFFPVPGTLQKFLTSQLVLVDAFFFQFLDNLDLRGDGRVIRARQPQRVVALHPFETGQDILHGLVQGMAHVQLACDVWRGNHDGKGFSVVIHFRVEIFLVKPFFVEPVFQALGVVGLCQFFGTVFFHFVSFLLSCQLPRLIFTTLFCQNASAQSSLPGVSTKPFLPDALRRNIFAGQSSQSHSAFHCIKKALCRLSSAKGVINAVPPLFTAGAFMHPRCLSDFY